MLLTSATSNFENYFLGLGFRWFFKSRGAVVLRTNFRGPIVSCEASNPSKSGGPMAPLIHPSFFRGVKLKLSDHKKSQLEVVVGPLETSKHPSNKSFMEGNFTSGSCQPAIGLEPVPQLTIRFYDRRVIHSATEAEAQLSQNFS